MTCAIAYHCLSGHMMMVWLRHSNCETAITSMLFKWRCLLFHYCLLQWRVTVTYLCISLISMTSSRIGGHKRVRSFFLEGDFAPSFLLLPLFRNIKRWWANAWDVPRFPGGGGFLITILLDCRFLWALLISFSKRFPWNLGRLFGFWSRLMMMAIAVFSVAALR